MLGFKGIHGNKGAIFLKFKIYNSTVCLTNVHLFSGRKEVDKRVYGLKKVEDNFRSFLATFLKDNSDQRLSTHTITQRQLAQIQLETSSIGEVAHD